MSIVYIILIMIMGSMVYAYQPSDAPAPTRYSQEQLRSLQLSVRVFDPDGQPLASVPLGWRGILDKDMPIVQWGVVGGADGICTAALSWPKAANSIAVGLNTYALIAKTPAPGLERTNAGRVAQLTLDNLRSKYAFRKEYRFALARDQQTLNTDITAEKAISVSGTLKLPNDSDFPVGIDCELYDAVIYRNAATRNNTKFCIKGVPKGKAVILHIMSGSYSRYVPVSAQDTDYDMGIVDLTQLPTARDVSITAVYPAATETGNKYMSFALVHESGNHACEVFSPAALPAHVRNPGLTEDQLTGGVALSSTTYPPKLVMGKYVAIVASRNDDEDYRSIVRALRAGVTPESLGLVVVTVPGTGSVSISIDANDAFNKSMAYLRRSSPLAP